MKKKDKRKKWIAAVLLFIFKSWLVANRKGGNLSDIAVFPRHKSIFRNNMNRKMWWLLRKYHPLWRKTGYLYFYESLGRVVIIMMPHE